MLGSTCKSVRDQGMASASHCLHMLISMHGWRKAFIMVNSSVGACDLLAYAQGVHRCELSVMEISFDQTLLRHNIKRCPLTLGAAENICSINGDHTKTTTQIHHTELVCALLIPRFYTSDFEKETEKRENTQVHCIKGHTVAYVRQELWRHSNKNQLLGG